MKTEMTEEEATAFMAQKDKEHAEWLAKPLTRSQWLDLLMRCQSGEATCLYVLEKIEAESDVIYQALKDLNHKVHSGYDFNGDPEKVTLRVGKIILGE